MIIVVCTSLPHYCTDRLYICHDVLGESSEFWPNILESEASTS